MGFNKKIRYKIENVDTLDFITYSSLKKYLTIDIPANILL